jgi:exopolysaccharide biosynthesis protein PssK
LSASNHIEIIAQQTRAADAVLARAIPADSEIVLLDYPDFSNIGDSLIWLGALSYLKSRGLRVRYVASIKNYDRRELRKCVKSNTVILFSGGGNFGTLYPHHQYFRELVLGDFPDVAAVQLPQSIHFDDPMELQRAQRSIAAHRKFTLLARDESALQFGREYFDCGIDLCPDMAFFLGPLTPAPALYDIAGLVRTDHESGGVLDAILRMAAEKYSVRSGDWIRDLSAPEIKLNKIIKCTRTLRDVFDGRHRLLALLWNRLAQARLQRGSTMLSAGQLVVTDRLHGHILALLLGRPHIVVDNNNGKVAGFHRTWTAPSTITSFCHSAEQLPDQIHSMMKSIQSVSTQSIST